MDSKNDFYEYCPRCDANLTLQKGFDPTLSHWVCKGCGEMLINPVSDDNSNIIWICDGCGATLNEQEGFTADNGEWKCSECGYVNKTDESEVYLSEDEYAADLSNPYKGLSDEEVLRLAYYQEVRNLEGCGHVVFVEDPETSKLYVKKYLKFYDRSIFDYLKVHPVEHIPEINDIMESDNCLIVIEEYIKGKTVAELLDKGSLDVRQSLSIALQICSILMELHSLERPIVHRDIKPSNVILTDEQEVYLIDINASKWINRDAVEDTKLIGTQHYAAPEQYGFGFRASTDRTDIYSLGILINKMLTGKYPKEEMAPEPIGHIIKKCISFEQGDRYDAKGLYEELKMILGTALVHDV